MKREHLSNSEEEAKEYSTRYKILYIGTALTFSIIFCRLWFLQIIQGTELIQFSERNRVKETKIPAPRGLMLDRDGRVLVDNLPGFEASISPQYATKLNETAQVISPVLGIASDKIMEEVIKSRKREGHFKPVRIKDHLSLEDVYRLKLIRWDHPGLNINEIVVRHYPLGANGAQLFGYVGEISKEQLPKYNEKYQDFHSFEQGDFIGKSGLEEVWERYIRGQDGLSYVEVDARGREAITDFPSFLGLKTQEPVSGNHIMLTIDLDIQQAALKAMNREDATGPRIGGAVAMKTNGEILAWVNTPSFDPNQFSKGMTAEVWRSLINDPFKPLRNKIIQDHFSPGSTFKPIVALAALQEKVITPNTVIFAPGFIKFGRRMYHDHVKQGFGNVTVYDAIERSSNIFFYKMGIQLGFDRIAEYAQMLGLGARTDVGLANEMPGLIPNSDWKLKSLGEEWQPGENLSNAIGQGYVLATAMQMAVAYNTIGLEGKVVKPFLIKRIISPTNQILKEFEPQIVRDVSQPQANGMKIDKSVFKIVREAMRRVVQGDRGTAKWWRIPGIEFAGKTGTTQLMSFSADSIYDKCELRPLTQRHHGWFVAFAPADNPEIAIAVLAEHACHGSTGAAPVARDIIEAYFAKYHPEKLKKLATKTLTQSGPTTENLQE